ncbi:MAG TPA: globin domain-containing protein [Rhodanobacteraceae bacterium]
MYGSESWADSLTADEIGLVRASFDHISVGLRFSQKFYARLFEIAPELRVLFPPDLSAQVRKLMDMLATLVEKLDRPHELALTLEALGAQHRDYGVKPENFAPVGRALFETLEGELGPVFDEPTRRAWVALYALATSWMQQSIPRERCA